MVDLLTPGAMEEAARKQVEDMSVLSSKNTFAQETMMLDLLTPEEMTEPVRKQVERRNYRQQVQEMSMIHGHDTATGRGWINTSINPRPPGCWRTTRTRGL